MVRGESVGELLKGDTPLLLSCGGRRMASAAGNGGGFAAAASAPDPRPSDFFFERNRLNLEKKCLPSEGSSAVGSIVEGRGRNLGVRNG